MADLAVTHPSHLTHAATPQHAEVLVAFREELPPGAASTGAPRSSCGLGHELLYEVLGGWGQPWVCCGGFLMVYGFHWQAVG